MAKYYLISQLPSLDGIADNMPLPITEERFLELCNGFLAKNAMDELKKLTLVPPQTPEKSSSALVEAWNEGERNLRLALGKARANKLKKTFDAKTESLPLEAIKTANAAVEIENPLEAENFLFDYRMKFLETLRPIDTFSQDFIFYYGLKLKLMQRSRQFDAKLGETAYRNIYNSVLNGNRLEAM